MGMNYKITVLGCGNAAGTPAIGNFWGDCDPKEPKNKRLRASIAVQSDETTLIIDTGPDFRQQLNRAHINDIDAVLYSHAHSDHVAGIDDLRMFFFRYDRTPIPVYANTETLKEMQRRLDYVFDGGKGTTKGLYHPIVTANEITQHDIGHQMMIGDIEFTPFEQDHTTCTSLGFRIADFAYSTDMQNLDDASIETLKGVKTWLVDGAAYKKTDNFVHASFQNVFDMNKRIGAQNVFFTHMSCFMDYKTMVGELPDGYAPAYDGLMFDSDGCVVHKG